MQSSIAGETEVARTGCGCVAVLGFRELAKAESTSGGTLQMTRMKYGSPRHAESGRCAF